MDRVFGQSLGSIAARHFAAEDRPDHPVGVADVEFRFDLFLALQRRRRQIEQHLIVESVFQAVILWNLTVPSHFGTDVWLIKYRRVIQPLGFPMRHRMTHFELVGAADHLVDRAHTELGHMLAHFLGDEAHEVDDVGRVAVEFFAQLGILRRHAHRAGVEMADAHHDAAQRDQSSGGKTKLFRAEQRRDHHVAAGFQLAVGLHRDAAAQIIENQSLMRFRQAQFPRQAGVFDAGLWRGAGAAVVAADQHHVGVTFGNARGNRADADLRN